jgi:hypothetical protein
MAGISRDLANRIREFDDRHAQFSRKGMHLGRNAWIGALWNGGGCDTFLDGAMTSNHCPATAQQRSSGTFWPATSSEDALRDGLRSRNGKPPVSIISIPAAMQSPHSSPQALLRVT